MRGTREEAVRELRLAIRRLQRRPGRGIATALALAIGIGATTAAFAAVDAVLLRDLPVEDQDELVVVWRLNPERASLRIPFRTEDYDVLDRGQRSLSAMAGFTAWGALPVLVEREGEEYALDEVRVAGDFFGVLGARPAVGRLLDASDDDPGAAPVAVLSYRTWQTRYGGDPDVVGSSLFIRDAAVTIVGVGPRGLDFPRDTEVWIPLRGAPYELHVLGRMAPNVDPRAVASDVGATFAAGRDSGLELLADLEPVVRGLEEQIVGSVRPVLRAAFVAATLLLLAGAANATLFLLAGGRAAVQDVAVRRALGAERLQLVGRVLADSWVVCALGTAGGLGLAWMALAALLPLAPQELPRVEAVTLRGTAVAFAVVVGLLSALGTGATASVVLARLGDRGFLAAGGRGQSGGGAGFRRTVAGLQVTLAVVSAVGAGLLARTVAAMDRLDPGLAVADMIAVDLRVPYGWNAVPESYFAALDAVVAELESRPGITAARPTLGPPLQQRIEVVVTAEGQGEEDVRGNPFVSIDAVMPGHFQALGIPILAGRDLTRGDDRADADPVVVVDEVLAAALWPGDDPIGQRIDGFGSTDTWYTVVGVVAATRYRDLLEPHPRAYYPIRRLASSPPAALLIRTTEEARASVGDLVRDAFSRADPQVAVMDVRLMEDVLHGPTVGRRFAARVLVSFAAATLLLAGLGVYGAFTVSVQERTREMGIRRALGAQQPGIVALVLFGILKVSAVGASVGILVAVFAARLVESLLVGVAPTDAATLAAVLAGSILVAVCAGLAPAIRASSTDPATSLRTE